MDEFQSEKEQIEEIKKWWREHRGAILTGVVISVGGLGGFKYWSDFKERRASAASVHYDELAQAIAQRDRNGATVLLEALTTEFEATPYSSQGALAMAKSYVQSGEPELAIEQLSYVLDHSSDDYLKLVARLRLARVQLSQEQADAALATLDVVNPGSFAARFHEVRGDAYEALGRNTDARLEYLNALDKFEPGLIDRQMVEMKMNNLPAMQSAAATGTPPEAVPETAPDTVPESMPEALPDAASDTVTETEPDA